MLAIGAVLLLGALSLRAWAQSRSAKASLERYASQHAGTDQWALTNSSAARFPTISGSNLERRTFNLPADFEGELNLVAVAFLREHQDLIDTWAETAERLTQADSRLRFYEVPVLSEANGMFSFVIDGGMRAGIPSRATREATITLYTDREAFLKTAGLPGPQTIYLLLTDRSGKIFWRGQGAYTEAQGASLEEAIRKAGK